MKDANNSTPRKVAKAIHAGKPIFIVGSRRSWKNQFTRKVNIALAKIERFNKGR
jgi:hypothetical protein